MTASTLQAGRWVTRRGVWEFPPDTCKPLRLEDADPAAILEATFPPLTNSQTWATLHGATDRSGHAIWVRGFVQPISRKFYGLVVTANKSVVGIYRYAGDIQVPLQEYDHPFAWDPKLRVETQGNWIRAYLGDRRIVQFQDFKPTTGVCGLAIVGSGPRAMGEFSGFTVLPL